ncbi:MAG: phosphotransferase, partial [Parvularculaceae bacterium]
PAAAAALIDRLADTIPPEHGEPVLLHMDLKPDNLLVNPATLAPRAMIDWDMATRGPRGFDLAVLLSYWIEPGDPPATHALQAVPSLAPGAPTRAGVAARPPPCQLSLPIRPRPIRDRRGAGNRPTH